ncbi:MAG TPA: MFS transporter [Vicinamibacterales bacterium]|jgi:MFS family permease
MRAVADVSARPSDAHRVAMASAIGTTIEWYDFFIYGTAAATVFGPQFFPQVSEFAGTLTSFATFGVGFLARPLGGVVMGHFGDRLGRKSMLVWSLMLMGLSTFGIGVLPNYASIGLWAPALLIVFRLVQGFALGGEWGGAVLMSVEHAPDGRRGFFGSFVALGLPVGIILSNLVFLIASTMVPPDQFARWGWRIPFLASAALVIVGVFIRLGIAESPVFEDARRRQLARRMPVADVLRTDARTVLLAAGSYTAISALGYITIVYFVSYATRQLGVTLPTTLALLLGSAVLFAGSIFCCAVWSDRVGRRRVMHWGMAALVAWSVIYFPLADTRSVPLIGLALAGMLVVQGAYIGPQPAVFSELFPTTTRYSGASLALTLGTIVGGAPAPSIATALYQAAGSSRLITIFIVTLATVSWLCVLGLPETYQDDLTRAR